MSVTPPERRTMSENTFEDGEIAEMVYQSPCSGGDLHVTIDDRPCYRNFVSMSIVRGSDVYLNVKAARIIADRLLKWATKIEKRNEDERNAIA